MSSIVKGLTDLVQGVFNIIYGTIATIVNTVLGTFEAAVNFVVSLIKGVFNISEDILKLIVGNLGLLLGLFLLYWGYVIYQQRQGNSNPQPIKELSGKINAAAKKQS
ncbi:uncharacterized protein AB675_5340 [Cyphellophora attinorum]|uniref:Uncharacterized protein n=1 Tax=Cyphellophora attinorum TaxID=1664694 RepID=A0A0N1HCM0_9EURO|nr:uncharacterized protein AB675_5340 [Phialophora attinorum]KPI42137.1 hypothetical protein AB675_5340 [Phialophora attinorum]